MDCPGVIWEIFQKVVGFDSRERRVDRELAFLEEGDTKASLWLKQRMYKKRMYKKKMYRE